MFSRKLRNGLVVLAVGTATFTFTLLPYKDMIYSEYLTAKRAITVESVKDRNQKNRLDYSNNDGTLETHLSAEVKEESKKEIKHKDKQNTQGLVPFKAGSLAEGEKTKEKGSYTGTLKVENGDFYKEVDSKLKSYYEGLDKIAENSMSELLEINNFLESNTGEEYIKEVVGKAKTALEKYAGKIKSNRKKIYEHVGKKIVKKKGVISLSKIAGTDIRNVKLEYICDVPNIRKKSIYANKLCEEAEEKEKSYFKWMDDKFKVEKSKLRTEIRRYFDSLDRRVTNEYLR